MELSIFRELDTLKAERVSAMLREEALLVRLSETFNDERRMTRNSKDPLIEKVKVIINLE